MPSPNLVPVMSHISPEERETLRKQASALNMTVSAFFRRVITGRPIPDANKLKNIDELIKIAADQARLGNLFKLALNEDDFNMLKKHIKEDAVSIMSEIHQTNMALLVEIRKLKKT